MNLSLANSIGPHKFLEFDADHSLRVEDSALRIARRLDLDSKTCGNIALASRYHDVGKSYLVESILCKPGPLTAEEMEHVKCHVLYSAAIAIENNFSSEVIRYIYHHHEDFDGFGYPSGLKDRNIPVGARIIRIADFYDALTHDRVYKKKCSSEDAISVMQDNLHRLDPDIFDTFLSVVSRNSIEFCRR